MDSAINPDKVKKWWQVIKTIIEVILAALGGAAVAATAQSCGLLDTLSQL